MTILQALKHRASLNADIRFQRMTLSGLEVELTGLSSLIDFNASLLHIQQQVHQDTNTGLPLESVIGNLGPIVTEPTEHQLMSSMLAGHLILWFERIDAYVLVAPVSRPLSRTIEPPTTENVLRGSISAFVEDIDTNIGLIRKHVASPSLHVHSYLLGTIQKKRIVLLCNDNVVDVRLRDAIVAMLEKNKEMNIQNLQQLSTALGFSKWSLVTKFNTSELPQEAETALSKGKVVLFMDRMPFAIILPSLMWDMFAVENDRSFPVIFMYAIRFLRVFGVLINILIPGLYVALVSVNPDVMRIELALTIAKSRIDVPYPSLVETLLLLVILELILEASIRLPKSIGPTLTMVGGIILGQAVVSAKLVSNLLIIILAATTIANSAVVGFQNSVTIRLFKYLLVVLSAIYGVMGLLAGLFLVCSYMAGVTSFGIPYMHMMKPRGEPNG
ncbi:spore germination protein [Paenibacillus sp. PAMC21692]|uniref:spore germination protein n=1 Tax=Paenibacillus sp. PAMC21692 TaxID=2762320 RepID=UPI00164E8376|nr:spore germination protein [Paenibacillus sp. PAMC21692]QNK54457.1 spore germination protein [Paenibacillus sp. PAMC21692]